MTTDKISIIFGGFLGILFLFLLAGCLHYAIYAVLFTTGLLAGIDSTSLYSFFELFLLIDLKNFSPYLETRTTLAVSLCTFLWLIHFVKKSIHDFNEKPTHLLASKIEKEAFVKSSVDHYLILANSDMIKKAPYILTPESFSHELNSSTMEASTDRPYGNLQGFNFRKYCSQLNNSDIQIRNELKNYTSPSTRSLVLIFVCFLLAISLMGICILAELVRDSSAPTQTLIEQRLIVLDAVSRGLIFNVLELFDDELTPTSSSTFETKALLFFLRSLTSIGLVSFVIGVYKLTSSARKLKKTDSAFFEETIRYTKFQLADIASKRISKIQLEQNHFFHKDEETAFNSIAQQANSTIAPFSEFSFLFDIPPKQEGFESLQNKLLQKLLKQHKPD